MARPVTFGEYLQRAQWPGVAAILQQAYPEDFTEAGFTLDDYRALFERFRQVAPVASDLTICLEWVIEDDAQVMDVFGRYPEDPHIRWAIEVFVPAEEWVGAAVEAPQGMTAEEIVAHALAEWTWGGMEIEAHRPRGRRKMREGDDDVWR